MSFFFYFGTTAPYWANIRERARFKVALIDLERKSADEEVARRSRSTLRRIIKVLSGKKVFPTFGFTFCSILMENARKSIAT
jgi:hypothetical protein